MEYSLWLGILFSHSHILPSVQFILGSVSVQFCSEYIRSLTQVKNFKESFHLQTETLLWCFFTVKLNTKYLKDPFSRENCHAVSD